MTDQLEFYRTQSRWSDPGRWAPRVLEIPAVPEVVVRIVSGIFLHPFVAPLRNVAVPDAAVGDRDIRSVEAILDRVMKRDANALAVARTAADRFFCVCSGFARMAASVFRAHHIPARCRVGFAAYLNPPYFEDHWVCEYWTGTEWRLLDAQLDEVAVEAMKLDFAPWDVPRELFVDAGTAWGRVRAGAIDPARIGLSPLGFAGLWFVAGNLLLDVAALNKMEMLPWEKWSIAAEIGPGMEIPSRWENELDRVAGLVRGAPHAALAQQVYGDNAWLQVPPTVLSFLNGWPPCEVAVG